MQAGNIQDEGLYFNNMRNEMYQIFPLLETRWTQIASLHIDTLNMAVLTLTPGCGCENVY
ncbi:hypothetical protein E2C01_059888 [Portunus trituberculatus]|uniref:Uncharacterized protein n=1 Tax=Portunus trituberculatus TaxID=210409 RepID=A0A5B7H3U8_PORTR|nr:hypothetical protein [Portunus trituberculatus]